MEKFTAKYIEKLPNQGRGQKIYGDEIPPLAAVPERLSIKVDSYTQTFFLQYRFEGENN